MVFLLFVIGLELELQRLWAMRHTLFGLGTLQVVLTGLALAAAAAGQRPAMAGRSVLGFGLALSSTAFVLPAAGRAGRDATRHGRAASPSCCSRTWR